MTEIFWKARVLLERAKKKIYEERILPSNPGDDQKKKSLKSGKPSFLLILGVISKTNGKTNESQ